MNSEFKPYLPVRSLESEFREASEVLMRQQRQRRSRSGLRYFAQALLHFFTGQQAISVRQETKNGKTQWIVYDPQQDIRQVFDTEQSVRVWLERRVV